MDAAFASVAATATSILSALSAYGSSPHCHWMRWRRSGLARGWIAAALALVALALWIVPLGVGAGACAWLGTWMLAAMLLPYLGAWTRAPLPAAPERR